MAKFTTGGTDAIFGISMDKLLKPGEHCLVPVDNVDEHPGNRKVEPAHVGNLAASIERDGLIEPIIVRPAAGDPTRYQHISGWHRVLAYRQLRDRTGDRAYDKIPAVVRDVDDETAERWVAAANLLRMALSEGDSKAAWLKLADMAQQSRALAEEAERNGGPANPYKGKRSSEIIRESMVALNGGEAGIPSARTIDRRLSEARDEQYRDQAAAAQAEDNAPRTPEPPHMAAPCDEPDAPDGVRELSVRGEPQRERVRVTGSPDQRKADPEKEVAAAVKQLRKAVTRVRVAVEEGIFSDYGDAADLYEAAGMLSDLAGEASGGAL